MKQKISITSKSQSKKQEVKISSQTSKVEVANRRDTQFNLISKRQFIQKIEHNGKLVLDNWRKNDKVKSLRKMIKCMKFLCTNTDPTFTPIKFVTIMDIYQKFSDLVFLRFKLLAFPDKTEKDVKHYSNE